MLASSLSFFRLVDARESTVEKPPQPRPSPIFIADAVQPWGRDTMLLSLLRRDRKTDD
ncbi:hypothetical protein KX928_16790 [Roseobacter sp. YSTF-M11]|uniref:Uncharacterized protein n=1 Tax=Roseobacter insulae TaxID=2859783 RepID=A0A9X1FYN1_9RHOB|nr:hypothetical protein [Roseobacter insulae]MBW4709450.1 hypothetical protein [Roseobacter insulae]